MSENEPQIEVGLSKSQYDNFVRNDYLLMSIVTTVLNNTELSEDGESLKLKNDDVLVVIKNFATGPYLSRLNDLRNEATNGESKNKGS